MEMTTEQIKGVESIVKNRLSYIFNYRDIIEFKDMIMDDIIEDIEDTADWSDFDEDEVCVEDAEIALSRVLLTLVGMIKKD